MWSARNSVRHFSCDILLTRERYSAASILLPRPLTRLAIPATHISSDIRDRLASYRFTHVYRAVEWSLTSTLDWEYLISFTLRSLCTQGLEGWMGPILCCRKYCSTLPPLVEVSDSPYKARPQEQKRYRRTIHRVLTGQYNTPRTQNSRTGGQHQNILAKRDARTLTLIIILIFYYNCNSNTLIWNNPHHPPEKNSMV